MVTSRAFRFWVRPLLAPVAALVMLTACQSKAQRAATLAAEAQQLAATGQNAAAQLKFDSAVALRDDDLNIWIARARNQVAISNYGGALQSYRSALDQDRANREALDALAQLSLAVGQLDDAGRYADQIEALNPGDFGAKLYQATIAYRRGRLDAAQDAATALLHEQPSNENVLVLLSQIDEQRGDLTLAALHLEPLLRRGESDRSTLVELTRIYERAANARGLAAVAIQDAKLRPRSPEPRLAFAKQLLLLGQDGEAAHILEETHRAFSGSATRNATVAMLLDADVPVATIRHALAMQAAAQRQFTLSVTQYALERGDVDTARALLGALMVSPADAGDLEVRAAAAVALAASGQLAKAKTLADGVLAQDPDRSMALKARVLIELAGGNGDAALRDARVVVRDNPDSPDARILLVRVLRARGEPLLADNALAEGVNIAPDNPTMVANDAQMLVARGRTDDAVSLLRYFTIRKPASVAGWSARLQVCRLTKDAVCVARAQAILDRLHGGSTPIPPPPPEETIAQKDYRNRGDHR